MKDDKGDKLNKAKELLYKLSLRDDFRLDVQQMRGHFGINPSEENREKLAKYVTKENAINVSGWENYILKKYKIPLAYLSALGTYIRFDSLDNLGKTEVAFIDRYAHKDWNGYVEEWYKHEKEPFVKIIVLNADSKDDLHKFIDKNWEEIQMILMEQGRDPERVRHKGERNKEIDKLIVRYGKLSTTQLKTKLGITKKGTYYKDDLIKNAVATHKDKDGKSYQVSDGYVRKIMQKYRQKNYP